MCPSCNFRLLLSSIHIEELLDKSCDTMHDWKKPLSRQSVGGCFLLPGEKHRLLPVGTSGCTRGTESWHSSTAGHISLLLGCHRTTECLHGTFVTSLPRKKASWCWRSCTFHWKGESTEHLRAPRLDQANVLSFDEPDATKMLESNFSPDLCNNIRPCIWLQL